MPTSAAVGLQQAAHAGQQVGVQRFGVEAARCSMARRLRSRHGSLRNCSRMIAAARGVEVARARRRAPRWWCSARRPRAPAGRSGRAAGAEAARARGVVVRGAVGMEGHADHQRVGCHSAISRPIAAKRASPSAAMVRSGVALRGQRVADRDADARACRSRKRGRYWTARLGGRAERRHGAHACPASWLSMRGVDAEQRQRLVVALLDRRVEDDRRARPRR